MKSLKLNETKVDGGAKGVYLEQGQHELKIEDWKAIATRKKGDAFIVDFKVLSSTTHAAGTVRNIYISAAHDMAATKIKKLLIAASGLSPSSDKDAIASEDWDALFDTSLTTPAMFIGRKVNCTATKQLKADAKKQAAKNPALLSDESWLAANSYLDMHFYPHDETREKLLAKLKGKPANDVESKHSTAAARSTI